MARKKDETKKVFDVSKPGETAASASSRPVIVGHKTLLQDPMVTTTAPPVVKTKKPKPDSNDIGSDNEAASGEPDAEVKILSTPELVIAPPKSEESEGQDDSEEKEKILKINSSKESDDKSDIKEEKEATEPKTTDESKNTESSPPEILPSSKTIKPLTPTEKSDEKEPTSTDEQAESEADDTDKPVETEAEATDKPVDLNADKNDKPDDEPESDEDDKPIGTEDSIDDKSTDQASATEDGKKDVKDVEAATKVAQDAAFQKLIDNKTYFVPIGEQKHKRSMRLMLVCVILLLIAILAIDNFLIDAGIVKTSIPPVTDVFKVEEP